MDQSNQVQNKISRNSSIELLKIIAIIFIVLSHSIPNGDIIEYSSTMGINFGYSIQIMIL